MNNEIMLAIASLVLVVLGIFMMAVTIVRNASRLTNHRNPPYKLGERCFRPACPPGPPVRYGINKGGRNPPPPNPGTYIKPAPSIDPPPKNNN